MTREEAIAQLRGLLHPGDTVQTILRHVSRSGMSRSISPVIGGEDVSYLVAPACGLSFDRKHGGVRMGGGGMDMGFALVYDLSRTLWPDGFGCVGATRNNTYLCPSNDHSNGDQDYTPHGKPGPLPGHRSEQHWHSDGGYALRHRWL
jgi:hypothetical protein